MSHTPQPMYYYGKWFDTHRTSMPITWKWFTLKSGDKIRLWDCWPWGGVATTEEYR